MIESNRFYLLFVILLHTIDLIVRHHISSNESFIIQFTYSSILILWFYELFCVTIVRNELEIREHITRERKVNNNNSHMKCHFNLVSVKRILIWIFPFWFLTIESDLRSLWMFSPLNGNIIVEENFYVFPTAILSNWILSCYSQTECCFNMNEYHGEMKTIQLWSLIRSVLNAGQWERVIHIINVLGGLYLGKFNEKTFLLSLAFTYIYDHYSLLVVGKYYSLHENGPMYSMHWEYIRRRW